jgi:hypothetical protein
MKGHKMQKKITEEEYVTKLIEDFKKGKIKKPKKLWADKTGQV